MAANLPYWSVPEGKCHPLHNYHFRYVKDTGKTVTVDGQDLPILHGALYCGDTVIEEPIYYFWHAGKVVNVADLQRAASAGPSTAGATGFGERDIMNTILIVGAVAVAVIVLRRS